MVEDVYRGFGPYSCSIHPGLDIVWSKQISLPADSQCSVQNFKAFVEGNAKIVVVAYALLDVGSPQLFDLRRVGTGKACHVGEQSLALVIRAVVVQEHRQLADGA